MVGTLSHALTRVSAAEAGRLRGVNRSGFEYDERGAGITREEIEEIVAGWGARIVRLPFNQDWVLNGAPEYLDAIDQAIGWAAEFGAYTLLDLQWLHAGLPYGGDNFVAPLPDEFTPELWRTLGARYRDEPAVLFDLFNEPHDPLPDDPYPLVTPDGSLLGPRVTAREWRAWAMALIEAIRGEHPESVLFVSGVEWGYDLRGMVLPAEEIVYSAHVYRQRGEQWHDAFGHLAGQVPLFAGEWGGGDTDLEWGRSLAGYFDALGMGWTAWSWSDRPRLQESGKPTRFGLLVRESLRR